jgi:hypothetical protein
MKRPFSFRCLVGFATAAFLLLVTGCDTVSINSNRYTGGTIYAPTDPASVQILHIPVRPHVRLGEITARPSSDNVSIQKIEAELKNAAAKMGANAVVIIYDSTQAIGASINDPWYGRTHGGPEARVITGEAIRYTDDSAN